MRTYRAIEDERFEFIQEAATKAKAIEFANERTRQQVLFTGMDCLAGQLDLFATDGVEPRASDEGA